MQSVKKGFLLRETIRGILNERTSPFGAVYCDMDGVIVNFELGAMDLIAKILDNTVDPALISGSKSIPKNVMKIKGELGDDWRPSSRQDLKIPIVRQVMLSAISIAPGDFFFSLPPLTDGTESLWPFLNSLGTPVHILSAPVRGRAESGLTADEGKKMWCDLYLSPAPESVIIADAVDKSNWALTDGVPNILVDDKKETVDAWNEMGGIGVLHLPGNSTRSIRMIKSILSGDRSVIADESQNES